ncbi:hypothetical protein PTKIN_Ptkin04bG0040400 [Pterospermum kingtungense]
MGFSFETSLNALSPRLRMIALCALLIKIAFSLSVSSYDRWRQLLGSYGPTNLQNGMILSTWGLSAHGFAFGSYPKGPIPMESLKSEEEDGSSKFGELARRVIVLFTSFCVGEMFPYLRWLDVLTGFIPNLKAVSQELDTFFDQIIEEHRSLNIHYEVNMKKDFVSILLPLQKDGMLEIYFTLDNIKAIIPDMYVGGTETTATTIEWMMAELLKHPNIMKKMQQERDPNWWGKPKDFVPERFENSSVDFKGQDFHFIPFGFGRKGCPRMPFAVLSIQYVVANLLYWFDWKLQAGENVENLDMSELYGLTVSKKVPLHVVPVPHFSV